MRAQHVSKGGREDIFRPIGDFAPSYHHQDDHDDFINLVGNYPNCGLTLPTNKLIAFTVIIKQIYGF